MKHLIEPLKVLYIKPLYIPLLRVYSRLEENQKDIYEYLFAPHESA